MADGGTRTGGGRIELVALRRQFGEHVAVDGIDIDIAGGEFFSLLGPSGCGKTTTLRMIAGFEPPTSGQILLDGVDMAHTPAHKRPVNTVFQSYALFPHLTVEENVAYGLRWRRDVDKTEKQKRIKDALALVRLEELAQRKPHQMSGGQQQRVALARALILKPRVLLLDEPLGALDAKLRTELRSQLTELQREVGITFVFVTHDQGEALEMSDRLAVMDGGRVVQCGAPRDVYERPEAAFVADFLGVANLFDVECKDASGGFRTVMLGPVPVQAVAPAEFVPGPARAVVRPEAVRLEENGGPSEGRLPALVERTVFQGSTTIVHVRLVHGPSMQVLVANGHGEEAPKEGSAVTVVVPPGAVRLLARAEAPTAA
jgi:spermidine/putrescine transport system ATP-binding protein